MVKCDGVWGGSATVAELLMWSDKGSSFFWARCALNGFPNRGFASISGLAKQRPSPTGVHNMGLMDLMGRWITLTLTNQTLVSALATGLLGSWEEMKTFLGMRGWWDNVKKKRRKGIRERKGRRRGKEMFGGKRNQGSQGTILRSPSLHPLALSSHQRHQGGPNELKNTSTSFNLAYLDLFLSSYSESS